MKKLIYFVLIVFVMQFFSIGAQSPPVSNNQPDKKEADKDPKNTTNPQNPGTEKTNAPTNQPSGKEPATQGGGVDKEYYEYYFTTLPDQVKLKKEKLEYNLLKAFKTEIVKRDSPACNELIPQINPSAVQYEKIVPSSTWVRGIKNVLGFLKYTDFMYIIKFQKYYAVVVYETDPSKYIQTPMQTELIFKKENVFESKINHP